MPDPTQPMMMPSHDDRRTTTLTAVASALVGFGVAYLLLLTQPQLAARATAMVREQMLPAGAQWLAPIAVAGVAIGVSGLGIYALRGFLGGVRSKPYSWLGPLLVALSGAVLLSTRAELPIAGLDVYGVTVPALLLVLGSGALFQAPGRGLKLVGVVLWSMPVLLIAAAYVAQAGGVPDLAAISMQEQLYLFMLASTWIALGATAWVLPDPDGARARASTEHVIAKLRSNLGETEARAAEGVREHARLSADSARLSAELQRTQQHLGDASLGRSRGVPWPLVAGLMAALLAGVVAGVQFGIKAPMERKLAAAVALSDESDRAHASAVEALEAQLATQRAELEEAAKAHDAALAASQAQPDGEGGGLDKSASAVKSGAVAKRARRAKVSKKATKRARARSKRASRDELVAGGDDPIAGLE